MASVKIHNIEEKEVLKINERISNLIKTSWKKSQTKEKEKVNHMVVGDSGLSYFLLQNQI
jgi:hypothetical protein